MATPTASRLLIVHGDEPIVRALGFLLEREGFYVRSASDGRSALEMLRGGGYDLVLIEVGSSEREAFKTLADIRHEEALRSLAVVLMTSRSSQGHVVLALDGGADDCILQPFHPREVIARLKAHLRIRRLQAQLIEAERWRVLLETAGAVAHEMSQPLTAVMGNLEILLHRLKPDDPHLFLVKRILENGERAVQLLHRLQRIDNYQIKAYPGTDGILDIERSSRG